jgi:hypothetical protein
MDPFLRETLARQRAASILAEADRDRLARTCRAARSEPGATWHRTLLAQLRGWVTAAVHRRLDAVHPDGTCPTGAVGVSWPLLGARPKPDSQLRGPSKG